MVFGPYLALASLQLALAAPYIKKAIFSQSSIKYEYFQLRIHCKSEFLSMDKIFLPFDKMWFFALFCPIFVITDGNLAQKSIFAIQALFLIDSIWIFEKKFFLE